MTNWKPKPWDKPPKDKDKCPDKGDPKPVPCFTPGTQLLTVRGPVLVENVKVGDRILTRDNGMQPVIWVGRRVLSVQELVENAALRPIRIARGSLGNDLPSRDMLVSPQHRFLARGPDLSLQFYEQEMLVPAKALRDFEGVSTATKPVTYIHLLFERHELVLSDEVWTESFQPSARMVERMDIKARAELQTLFPDLCGGKQVAFEGARPTLSPREVQKTFEIG
ncbi:MAG: Hint domain-containing protein [Sulfitobacter sp.]